MKKLLFIALFAFGSANAQNIVFNGTAFKNKLLQSSTFVNIARDSGNNNIKIDANGDGEITQQEAAFVYKLEVQQSSIPNLVGLEYFVNLTDLRCDQNIFSTIDVSTLTHLNNLDVSNNSSLISIYAKNGSNESISFGTNTPALSYICADESQVIPLQNSGGGLSGYTVNSYCTITPGGTFNNITGQILYDANNDGTTTPDIPFHNIKLSTSINGNTIQTVCDTSGNYNFYTTNIGNYTVNTNVENPSWFTFSPASAVGNFPNANNNIATHNFYIIPNGVHDDLEVAITPVSYPVVGSGSNVVYEVVFKNKGNQTHSGQVSFTYNQSQLNFISSTATLNNSGSGLLTLAYTGLLPFETRSFSIQFSLDASVNVNDFLQLNLSIDTNGEDTSTQSDNSFLYNQKALNTAVANSIECLEGTSLPTVEIGSYLHYAINYQNTGNQLAKNVTIKTVFDSAKFDLNSLQLLNSTSPVDLEVINNTVYSKVRNANVGGPGGQGGILLKIKTIPTLQEGTTVNPGAEIFFDYDVNTNPLNVMTENASTTFQNLSVTVVNYDGGIKVYPNPASSFVTIDSSDSLYTNIKLVELFDISGRLLQTNILNEEKMNLDISERANGIYFIKISSDKGQKVEKIVKK